MNPVRFETMLRGELVEVEMEILSFVPYPSFTITFLRGGTAVSELSGGEIAMLARCAAVAAGEPQMRMH